MKKDIYVDDAYLWRLSKFVSCNAILFKKNEHDYKIEQYLAYNFAPNGTELFVWILSNRGAIGFFLTSLALLGRCGILSTSCGRFGNGPAITHQVGEQLPNMICKSYTLQM